MGGGGLAPPEGVLGGFWTLPPILGGPPDPVVAPPGSIRLPKAAKAPLKIHPLTRLPLAAIVKELGEGAGGFGGRPWRVWGVPGSFGGSPKVVLELEEALQGIRGVPEAGGALWRI